MLFKRLLETAEKYPDKIAIVYNDLKITFRELLQRVRQFSRGLKGLGVDRGDCLAAIIQNSPEFVITFLAVARCKAIILPINPAFKMSEIKRIIDAGDARTIVTDPVHVQLCQDAVTQLRKEIRLILVKDDRPGCIRFEDLLEPDDRKDGAGQGTPFGGEFIYLFSSGSTGRPKRLARTQKNYCFEMDGFIHLTGTTAQDSILCAIPLFHSHGIGSCLLPALGSGAQLVILEHFSPKGSISESLFFQRVGRMFDLIQGERVTIFPAVPYIFHAMIDSPIADPALLRTVRLCFSSGNFLPRDIYEAFLKTFHQHIKQIYGCSEAGAVSISVAEGDDFRMESVGTPLPGIEIKILGDDGEEMGVDQVGEVVFRSPGQTAGYKGLPELNRQAFRDGFFYSGDLGKLDEKGCLTIAGRKKLLIDTGGNKVDPYEVEDVLCSHQKVKEAVVVGIKATSGNEIVKAAVVPAETCSEEEIVAYCRRHLADFKVPKIVEFIKEIPKSPVGKILRKDLISRDEFNEKLNGFLKKIFQQKLGQSGPAIDAGDSFGRLGIDSATVIELNALLVKYFGDLPKTLFFEYDNINDLAKYLIESQRDRVESIFGTAADRKEAPPSAAPPETGTERVEGAGEASRGLTGAVSSVPHDVAVIGLHGRYPGAADLAEFWENLKSGKDCVTEVPADRWRMERFFSSDRTLKGKTYTRWGGFLTDIDKFDALLFSIAPKEAELMDPQERLFLEQVWATLEDAGYPRRYFLDKNSTAGRVGVFVGVMWGNYQFYGVEQSLLDYRESPPRSHYWAIANRISYFFNFTGPSLAVDTACSSSLTALHLACESIDRDECAMAVAGGVNLALHPLKYILTADGQYASTDGKCRSFGDGGDGYVPGEGVGAVLLKPLRRAEAEGDHIYAIIKGTALNHIGHTKGFTVPSPRAQADVVAGAFERSGITPDTVNYIEAHGTGTILGDPIEIRGLSFVFQKHTSARQFCAIGSVKSNIGHLEAAAGIASLTKVLLQLKHRQLVPSLHADILNPNINFQESAFFVQRQLSEWKAPRRVREGKEQTLTRRAGISSFGAGGSNAHVLVEEYPRRPAAAAATVPEKNIVVLSASDRERLSSHAANMLGFFRQTRRGPASAGEHSLTDYIYTLQVGREPLEERLAFIASNWEELEQGLDAFISGEPGDVPVFTGNSRSSSQQVNSVFSSDTGDELVKMIVDRREYEKLAQLWVSGIHVRWELLYPERPCRVSLPTYPFARERHWISNPVNRESIRRSSGAPPKLHPLIDRNISDFSAQRFTTSLDKDEFYVMDHVVKERHFFPAVAYIEMARAAGELSWNAGVGGLTDLVWESPIVVEKTARQVDIELVPGEEGSVDFTISTSLENGDRRVHSRGRLVYDDGGAGNGAGDRGDEMLDLAAVRERCTGSFSGEECYRLFETVEFRYGAGFRSIRELAYNGSEALAYLELPAELLDGAGDYLLHPSLLDGVLHSVMGLEAGSGNLRFGIPMVLEEIKICGGLPVQCVAHVRHAGPSVSSQPAVKKYHIDVCDGDGRMRLRLRNYTVRESVEAVTGSAAEDDMNAAAVEEVWETEPATSAVPL